MQRKHILMLAGKNLIADTNDQQVLFLVQTLARVVRIGRALFQDAICRDHLSWHQVCPDTEVLDRALRLRSPELVGGHWYIAQGVFLNSEVRMAHHRSPFTRSLVRRARRPVPRYSR